MLNCIYVIDNNNNNILHAYNTWLLRFCNRGYTIQCSYDHMIPLQWKYANTITILGNYGHTISHYNETMATWSHYNETMATQSH